eukprot:342288_1
MAEQHQITTIDIEQIKKIINNHSTLSVNELSQICHNIITDLITNDDNLKLMNDENDINQETELILSSFAPEELDQYEQLLNHEEKQIATMSDRDTTNDKNSFDKNIVQMQMDQKQDFQISWHHICNAVHHEMWPKLANIIRAIIRKADDKFKLNDLSDEYIDEFMKMLKNKRQLSIEEQQYLMALLARAKSFEIDAHSNVTFDISTDKTDFDINKQVLNQSLLQDIFDVHQWFIFSNFNFATYSIQDFHQDLQNCEKHLRNLSFEKRCDLYPEYLIEDDLYEIFDCNFAVSQYVNELKQNMKINQKNKHRFHIKMIVIPKRISCIYDENISFNCSINSVEEYLVNKNVYNFYKCPLKQHDIKYWLELYYGIEDINTDQPSKLLIVVDRRRINGHAFDNVYLAPYGNHTDFSEFTQNYFIGFDYYISANNERNCNAISVYFRYGRNQMVRFYPEHLTTIIPRLFRKHPHLSEVQVLDKLYGRKFKHGWCVTLADTIFNKYYKIITGYTHISVNYNRQELLDEFYKETPMLCFTELMAYEVVSANFDTEDIKALYKYYNENDYDSDSIINDILFESSNIANYFRSNDKYHQFETVKNIVIKYHDPAEKNKIQVCDSNHILDADNCVYVQNIVDALKLYDSQNNFNDENIAMSVSNLLAAYDHIISVHEFCKIKQEYDNENKDEKNQQNDIGKYMVTKIGGYCNNEQCLILERHAMRRRENKQDEKNDADNTGSDSAKEIATATLNALHCYITHVNRDLYRLKTADSHFVSSIDNTDVYDQKDDADNKSASKINFGVSVLEWFTYGNAPNIQSFRKSIVENKESTINEQMFLGFSQECFIKLNNRKYEQWTLNELLSVKIYTDTNSYQSSLRKAHWKSASKETKQSFYHWALLLYESSLFHSKPIPRWTTESEKPCKIYHGLNLVLILDNACPVYCGPVSTTLEQSVAHSFSKAKGLIWTIKPSYNNKFKFVAGICVDWISQHKHESEILLINQHIPIASTIRFSNEINDNVDHLLYSLKSYTKTITNKNQFYRILGMAWDEEWLPIIVNHNILYEETKLGNQTTVLHRLIEELEIREPILLKRYQVLSSRFTVINHRPFNYSSIKIEINNNYQTNKNNMHLMLTKYKYVNENSNETQFNFHKEIIFSHENSSSGEQYAIFIRNDDLFAVSDWICLQQFSISTLDTLGKKK